MARNSQGTYTLPAGNPVVSGAVIESTWANATMADIGNEISQSLDRGGRGGMLAPLKLVDGSSAAPGLAFSLEAGSGLYRKSSGKLALVIAGVEVATFEASKISSSVEVAGNVTGDVTGNLTGDVTGNVTGDVTGNLTGDVTGNVTGDLTGDVTGDLTGDASGATLVASSYVGVTANWKIDVGSGTLRFKYNDTVVATLSSTGVFTAKGDVVRNTSL